MATLAEIRKQYPQYNDLSDQQLADALYRKNYADMPRAEFDRKVGLSKPGLAETVAGGLSTLYRSIPFADEVNDTIYAKVKTPVDFLTGKAKPQPGEHIDKAVKRVERENYRAAQARSKALSDDFKTRRPLTAAGVEGAGLALQVLPALATGGGSVAPSLAAKAAPTVGKGLLGSSARATAARLAKPVADSAVVSGLSAQAAGLGGDGSLAERVQAANDMTPTAMAVGAATPPLLAAGGYATRKTIDAFKGGGRAATRIANRAAGGKLLDPQAEAARRLGEALEADGVNPDEIAARMARWRTSGASDPTLMDLAGENTRALLRSAASKSGAGRNRAVAYVDQVTGDLQDNVVSRADRLTRDRRTADEYAEMLEKTQRDLADKQYRGPYETPVPVTDELAEELRDDAGRAAMAAARADALERRDMARVAEIDRFLAETEAKAGVVKLPDVEPPYAPLHVENPRGEQGLLGYLRSIGGLRDEGGELQGMDLGRDRGRFQKDWIINPNGVSLDEAARRAWEDGFFPDAKLPGGADLPDNYTPVTADDLLRAIDKEVRGTAPPPDWIAEDDFAASVRWMDDSEDTLPPLDEGWWQSLGPSADGRPILSGATLDRARIALGERGNKFAMRGNNARAGGSFMRRGTIDTVLDDVPALREARATYRGLQAQRDAVPVGQAGLRTPADRYKRNLRDKTKISPAARKAAGIGYRQAIVDAVSTPAESATGLLNRLATSRNQRENLAATFGRQEGELFQEAVQREIDRLRNARFVSPNEGSKTANVLIDEKQLKAIPTSRVGILMAILDKLRRGVTLTDAERDAMLEIATRQISAKRDIPSIPMRDGTRRLMSPATRHRLGRVAGSATGVEGVRRTRERQ